MEPENESLSESDSSENLEEMENLDEILSGSESNLSDMEDRDDSDSFSTSSDFLSFNIGQSVDIRDTNFKYACLKACGLMEKKKDNYKDLLNYIGGLTSKLHHNDYFTPKYKFVVTGYDDKRKKPKGFSSKEKITACKDEDTEQINRLKKEADKSKEVMKYKEYFVLPSLPYELVFHLYFDLAYVPTTRFDKIVQYCYEERDDNEEDETYDNIDEFISKHFDVHKTNGFNETEWDAIVEEGLVTPGNNCNPNLFSKNNSYTMALEELCKKLEDLPYELSSK